MQLRVMVVRRVLVVLKIYDLRREAVMRESRDAINRDFWPHDEKEALAILDAGHPLNRVYRQPSTYREMVYGMARHAAAAGRDLSRSSCSRVAWAWCSDCYADYALPPRANDGLREASGVPSRVLRGGSWYSVANEARSANRRNDLPSFRLYDVGCRPARGSRADQKPYSHVSKPCSTMRLYAVS